MKKAISIALVTVTALAIRPASAQLGSAYFQAVTNLNPVVYFPLQDVFTPTWVNDVETNYGSLGQGVSGLDDAVYESQYASKGNGNLANYLDGSVLFNATAGSFLAVPTADTNTAILSPTLSVECWVKSTSANNGFEGIISKSSTDGGGINGTVNDAGWVLSQNYVAFADSANERGWDFHVFNGIGREGAEIIVPYSITNGVTYHLVATFDGVNCHFYVNDVDMVAAGIAIQIPMPAGTQYVPDTWDPLCLGTGRGQNANDWRGALGDVAIYTNVLSAASVNNHYLAAYNGPNYDAAVAADKPYLFYHMDSSSYTPPTTTYEAASYGLYSTNYIAAYGTAATPDAQGPQFPGLLDPSLANQSYAVQINGVGGGNGEQYNVIATNPATSSAFFVEDSLPINVMWANSAGGTDTNGNPLLNPTNHNAFSASCWFRANPTDNSRFQGIFGHSDSGWRAAITTGGGNLHFKPGNNGTEIVSDYGYNDGNWHHLVDTFDGTNVEAMYVDGRLSALSVNNNVLETGSADDVILGGDPQYVNCGNPVSTIPSGVNLNTGYACRTFSGAIAHFAFWTNALSAAQVENLYSNAVPNQAPYVIAQPVTGRVNPSPAFLYFATVADGTPPLNFQWYYSSTSNYNGTALVSGNKYQLTSTNNPANGTLQLVVSNLVSSDSGYYYCIVTNNYGAVTSILASLSVNYAPVITSQVPSNNFSLYSGQSEDMSVTVSSDTNGLSYQWYVNGSPDPSGTNAIYLTAPQTTAGNQFYCVVTNSSGSATSVMVSVSQILGLPAALTNSLFSSNILASGATAFWPMNDTGETPAPGDLETNLGAWGVSANGVYGDWRSTMQASLGINQAGNLNAPTNMTILHGIPGAIAGDTDPAECFFDSDGSEIVVPHSSPGLTITPPFTLEAWLRPNDNSGFGVAIGEHSGTFNATGNAGGFDWLYSGTSNTFSMTVYNGHGGGSTEPKTTQNYPPGVWYHVVTTFDGTNVQYYINGVQDSMNSPTGTNTQAAMAPNYWDPITIGCGRGLGNNYWRGSMDEVAIYTNYLMPLAVAQTHYQDGTNANYHNYKQDVLSLNPALYLRLDAPVWTPPPTSTWPTLTNYGSVAVNGLYTPNAVPSSGPAPSVDGVTLTGLPANSSFQSDGVMAFGDALNVPAFHPSGKTPFSVAAWVKGFPADDSARNWQSLVAEGDSSWRLNMNGGNGRANFQSQGTDVGNSTTSGTSATINDGQWHWVVGTCDGSNTIIYVDGQVSATNLSTANDNNQNVPIFLAGYPINNTSDATLPRDVAFEANATGNGSGRVLAGDLCDAAFWNGTALGSNQINSIYQSMDVPPVIERQPISANVNEDSGFTNVTIWSGTQPLNYQWYQNGSPRAGQTGPNLNLASVQISDIATNNGYYVVVNNAYGSATSAVVTLTVNSVPTLTQNLNPLFTNMTVWAGAQLPYSVAADGAIPLYYQWFSNNVAFAAASQTASNIVITARPAGATNNYYCIVTNSAGSVTSYVAQVTILALPTAPYVGTIIADHPRGFWRLNELGVDGPGGTPNNGVIAYDYAGGFNGIYTNASLDNPANNPNDTNAASAGFDFSTSFQDNDVFAIPTALDFSAPAGTNSNFSVECWVKGGGLQTVDAGLVTKGWGGGGEQWNMDCGSDGTTAAGGVTNAFDHSFRFFVRSAGSNVTAVVSAVNPQDQAWHHLVGVCDESAGYVAFYIDGALIGTNLIGSTAGIESDVRSMLIGSRPSNETTNNNDLQFFGYIQDVAVYPYALSAQQVLNHYSAAEVPAAIGLQPTNTVASYGGTAAFSVTASGSIPIGYQWWDQNANAPLNGATSPTLILNNITANDSFYCVVTNAFGTNQSQSASVTVITGAPQLYGDVQPQYLVLQGSSITIPVTAYGTLPISYQWLFDTNTVVQNNYRISGATTNALTINEAQLSDAGTYQCIITNTYGAVTSSIASLVVASVPVNFNSNGVSGNGLGWTARQSGTFSAPEIANGVLELTDNGGSEARSFFFNYPLYIGAFDASFVYTIGGNAAADGMAFVLQNDPRGAAALGGAGGSLGVSAISPSWELEFNIYTGNADGAGYNIFTNGNVGVTTIIPGINMTNGDNGDPIGVNMLYLNGQMTMTFTDYVTTVSYTTNFAANIPAGVDGQTAYVGFTGADGGSSAIQTITDFSFISIPTAQIQLNSPNAVISWPNFIPGYTLQESSSLTSPSWVNVPNPTIETNGMFEVTVPTSGQTEFYRLNAP
jgi:hypothetical protein